LDHLLRWSDSGSARMDPRGLRVQRRRRPHGRDPRRSNLSAGQMAVVRHRAHRAASRVATARALRGHRVQRWTFFACPTDSLSRESADIIGAPLKEDDALMRIAFRHLAPIAALPLVAAPVTLAAQGRGQRSDATFNLSANPLLSSFRFRSIGPASMGGRLDDIEVSLSDPNVIYIGYAVGGVFKSEDNGVSFKPVFQTYTTASIGDIAIHPSNPDIVYV